MNRTHLQVERAEQRQRRERTLRASLKARHAKGERGETARAWIPILIAALRGQQGPTIRTFTDTFNDRISGRNLSTYARP